MSRPEFATVMAYLATAINKPLSDQAHEVYFDLLGDLPLRVLQVAAKRVALEHKWATFPSVAELREAAAETMQGETKQLSAAEAWHIASGIAAMFDPDMHGAHIVNGVRYESQWHYLTEDTPPLVIEAMRSFGINALCYSKDPIGVVRGQFMKIFEQLAARDKRAALLPPAVKKAIAEIGSTPPEVKRLASDIGRLN